MQLLGDLVACELGVVFVKYYLIYRILKYVPGLILVNFCWCRPVVCYDVRTIFCLFTKLYYKELIMGQLSSIVINIKFLNNLDDSALHAYLSDHNDEK